MQGTYPKVASLLASVLGTAAKTIANSLKLFFGARNSSLRSVFSCDNYST